MFPKNADEIAYELQGTCKSLGEILEYYEMEDAENDMTFCAQLDQSVFCCEQCGWWFEISEMAEDDTWRCEECATEDNQND